MKRIITILTTLSILLNGNVILAKNISMPEFYFSSVHYCEDHISEATASAGTLEYTRVYPVTFGIKANISFKQPIKNAKLLITISTPASGSSVYWEFIGENCGYERISNTQFYLYCYNCVNATFCIFADYDSVHEWYDYSRVNLVNAVSSSEPWVTDNIYCDIIGVQIASNNSITYDTENDYTTQLNTLLSQTDSVENYLLQIWNNSTNLNSTLSNISLTTGNIKDNILSALNKLDAINTNVQAIQSYIDGIEGTLNSLLEIAGKNYNLDLYTLGVTATYNHRLYLDWSDINPKTVIPINDINYGVEYVLPENKGYKIIINLNNSISDHDVYYVYLPTGLTGTTQYISLYIYDIEDNGIYKIEFGIRSTTVQNVIKPSIRIKLSFLSFTDYLITEYNRIEGKINGVAYTDIDLSLEEMQLTMNQKINQIIDILDDININSTDLSDKEVVDSFYNQMKENLIFPESPVEPTNFARDFKSLIDTVTYIVNDEVFYGYMYPMLIYGIFILFRIVVK